MTLPIGTKVAFKGEVGIVRFAGETQFAPGVWIGVELQEPNGKNNGSVNGEMYFKCDEKYGIFVREPMLEILKDDGPLIVVKSRAASRNGSRAPSRIHSRSSDIEPISENDETSRLKSIIQKLQDKLLVMRSDIDKLKNELQTTESQNAELQKKYSQAEEDLELSAIDKETLEEQNELLQQEIKSLSEQNSSVLEELQSLKKELSLGNNIKDNSLINESTESLIKRNGLLEEALVKLRDHTESEQRELVKRIDDLESELMPLLEVELQFRETSKKLVDAENIIADLKSHIETSIHSTEIIETLTDKNNTLLEENEKLKSSVKELEDLRKVEEELEKFHVETESQLQQEIHKLEESLQSQQKDVSSLEERNKQLHHKAQELKLLNEKLQSQKLISLNDGAAQNSTVEMNNHHGNEGLELKFQILETELSFKEQELSHFEKIYGKSESTILKTTSLKLRKYSAIYDFLAPYIESSNNDLFINVLSIKLQFTLKSFSDFLNYAATKCEYFKTFEELNLGNIEAVTEKMINNIVDQDYRDIPDLEQLKNKILLQIRAVESAFQNRCELKYQLELELKSVDALLQLISVLNGVQAKTQFECSKHDLNQLYQLVQERKLKLVGLLDKFKATEDDQETFKLDLFSLSSKIGEFIEELLTKATELSTEVTGVNSEVNMLIELFKNHADDVIEWSASSIEKSWFLKDTQLEKYKPQEFEALQHELNDSKLEIEKKDKLIEEINLKVNVLNSRLVLTKETEIQLRKFKEDVASLSKDKDELNERVKGLLISNQQLSSDLQKARDNALLHNSQFESLLEQKKYNEKAELVSELHSLRNVVKTLTKRHLSDRSWLRVEIPKRKPFQKTEADELRIIGRDLQKAVSNAKIFSIKS